MSPAKVVLPKKEEGQENGAIDDERKRERTREGAGKGEQRRDDTERGSGHNRGQLPANEETEEEIRERWRSGVGAQRKGKGGKSGVQGRAEKKGDRQIQREVSRFRANTGGGEDGERRGSGECGDAAAMADKRGTMAEEAKEISAPKPEGEEGSFWGVGTDGRVASSVVRGTRREVLPDESGG